MAGPRVPLSTLRRRPCDRRRMTRGRGGWLGLPRTTLLFAIPCRSPGALMPEQPAESLPTLHLTRWKWKDSRLVCISVRQRQVHSSSARVRRWCPYRSVARDQDRRREVSLSSTTTVIGTGSHWQCISYSKHRGQYSSPHRHWWEYHS